jgi:hypothetical protein
MPISKKEPLIDCLLKLSDNKAREAFLVQLLEYHDDDETRLEAIQLIDEMEMKSQSLFKAFEFLLISESNEMVQIAAAKYLKGYFPEQTAELLNWVLIHSSSIDTIIAILKMIRNDNDSMIKSLFLKKLEDLTEQTETRHQEDIYMSKFKKVIKKLFKSHAIYEFENSQLMEILINYMVILQLTLKLPNVSYEVDHDSGLIFKLNLSDIFIEPRGLPFNWKNNIKTVADIKEIFNLSQLRYLDLSNNQLETFDELVQFKNLTHIIIAYNKISKISATQCTNEMKSLTFLDLHGNPVVNLISHRDFSPSIRVLLKTYLEELEELYFKVYNN